MPAVPLHQEQVLGSLVQIKRNELTMKIYKHLRFAIAGGVVFILIPIIIYIIHFCTHWFPKWVSLSDKQEIWGQWADFLNPFIGIVNIGFIAYLTYALNEINASREKQREDDNKKGEEESEKIRRAMERPVLTFQSRRLHTVERDNRTEVFVKLQNRPEYVAGHEIWSVYNIGNGPALNLKLAFKNAIEHKHWEKEIVKANSLTKEGRLVLEWVDLAAVLCVVYTDLAGTKYVSVFADDELETRIYSEEEFTSVSFGEFEITKEEIDKLNAAEAIRLPQALYPFEPPDWRPLVG